MSTAQLAPVGPSGSMLLDAWIRYHWDRARDGLVRAQLLGEYGRILAELRASLSDEGRRRVHGRARWLEWRWRGLCPCPDCDTGLEP